MRLLGDMLDHDSEQCPRLNHIATAAEVGYPGMVVQCQYRRGHSGSHRYVMVVEWLDPRDV